MWAAEVAAHAGAGRRRRERRHRAYLKYVRMSVAMALSGCKHHTSRGQTVDRAGEGVRGEVHGQVPGAPPPQAAGTQYFALRVDEVPAAGGSRPDRLAPVSGPQERFQRHSVEQLVESVRGVPVLDAPVPQMVEQLVEVPVPESVLEARGPDFAGVERRQFGLTGGIYWCMGRTTYTRRQRPVWVHRQPRVGYKAEAVRQPLVWTSLCSSATSSCSPRSST